MLARDVQRRQQQAETKEQAEEHEHLKKEKELGDKWFPHKDLKKRAANLSAAPASGAIRVRESALFRPVRALGVVTDEVPLAAVTMGDADFAVTSVGRGFQVFDCKHLRLAYVGPRLNEKVRALICVGEVVITSLKHDIVAWHKLIELGRFQGHTQPATVLATIGSTYLISAGGSEVFLWQLSLVGLQQMSEEDKRCVFKPLAQLPMVPGFGECTAACHPPTYMHKLLLGSSTGTVELWNVRSKERIHSYVSHVFDPKKRSGVTCLCEVPNVLDLIAVGFSSGRIVIVHGREDRIVMEFEQAQGRVTAMTFRTGVGAPAHLISGAPSGAFVVWDLDKRRAHHVHDEAHFGPISTVSFLLGQPLLLTSGRDNAVRMWIFDTPDGLPRLLRERTGCLGPARRMSFYGSGNDRDILIGGASVGAGFVAKISFIQDQQNKEYSQTSAASMPASLMGLRRTPSGGSSGRLPPVVDMAYCEVRHFDWPAVITAHERMEAAFLWSAKHQALSPKAFKPADPKDHAAVTAVAISTCGNYCVLGLENGALHRFNVQSQLHRGSIPRPPQHQEGSAKRRKVEVPKAHSGRICGVAITAGGQVVSLASHPGDSHLRVWKLMTHEPLASIPLGDGRAGNPSGLLLRGFGALVAISLDDGALLVVDLSGLAIVRTFPCGVPATDVAFSGDGRWLAVALRDGGLRIFDLLVARCVDSFVFAQPALSVCFSPSNAFMLTSHSKGNSIQVWANKFLFDPSLTAALLRPEPKEPVHIDAPGAPEEGDARNEADDPEGNLSNERGDNQGDKAPVRVAPLGPDLLTLSDEPPQKWMATLHLDLVKERNKVLEPPKPLVNAPFFLPTAYDGVTPRFAAPLGGGGGGEEKGDPEGVGGSGPSGDSRMLRGDRASSNCVQFQQLLRRKKYDEALTFLKAQTPSGVHLAIEELGPMAQGDLEELEAGLSLFEHHSAKSHFADEVQAYLAVFLQAHGEELANDAGLRERCGKLCQALERRWTAINAQCHKVRCFLGMLTHTQSQW